MHRRAGSALLQPVFFAALPDRSPLHEVRDSGDGGSGGESSIDGGGFCLKKTFCDPQFFSIEMGQFLRNLDI